MKRCFVTGTDTGVGKTVISAWLTHHWQADYWKPIQSGSTDVCDYDVVRQWVPTARIHPSAYVLQAPLSPHEAARLEGRRLDLSAICLPDSANSLVVEGAGGVLVPINEQSLMVDLMVQLALPVVLVARSGLGTINHTLLSLEALGRRSIPVLGVVMNGPPNAANRQAIEQYGQVPVLAELPTFDHLDAEALASLPSPTF